MKTSFMNLIMRSSMFALALAIGLFLQSCSQENVDVADAQVELQMKAQTNQSVVNARSINTGYVFTEILLGVTELEFETLEEAETEDEEGEDEQEEVEFEGEFIVDLIRGTSTPDFGMAEIAPGIYEEIEIEMEPILEGGYSIFVGFEFTNSNNEVVSVEYGNSDELEFEVENETGFVLDGGAANQMLILLNLDVLFTGVDLNTATADNDGVIRINESSNVDILETIASNLDHILDAGEDDDEDGDIDEDEEDEDTED